MILLQKKAYYCIIHRTYGGFMDRSISTAVNVIDDKINLNDVIDHFSKFYLFSNENLSGYLSDNNYVGKSAITVGSSGDQVFNLINYGCEDITLYDINPNIKYYYDLKKAAIYGLDKEEFFKFLLGFKSLFNRKSFFNYDTFLKISKYLDDDSKKFWDYLLVNSYNIKKLFFDESLQRNRKQLIFNNDYLKEDFSVLRRKMDKSNVNIYSGDINDMDKLDKKFDYIILSNVFDYLFGRVNNCDKVMKQSSQYIDLVNKIKLMLNDNGKLFFNYIWFYDDGDGCVFFRKLFSNDSDYFVKIIANSSMISSDRDCVYGYSKKKIITR